MSGRFGPDELLDCYARGVFPMADSADDPRLFLLDPDERGIIRLEKFHLSRRLARTVRQNVFEVRVDTAFDRVVAACAEATEDRPSTWINRPIVALYGALHRQGSAHSIECWQDGRLVGGLYGVSLGGAFFGESMFSRVRDASKVALVHLVGRMKLGGYTLLDTQFMTSHLRSFGAEEISRISYRSLLSAALPLTATLWPDALVPPEAAAALAKEDHLRALDQTPEGLMPYSTQNLPLHWVTPLILDALRHGQVANHHRHRI
jgi:leucyl/phenylalanyl-tRNA---protein transferase